MQPIPVLLSEEYHGQKSQEGYSPWGRQESDMTERLTLSLSTLLMLNTYNPLFLLNATPHLILTEILEERRNDPVS